MVTVLGNKQMYSNLIVKLKQRRVRNILIGLYVLFILGLSASVKAAELEQTQVFQGQTFQSVDGVVFLRTADEKVYELRSMTLGLNRFVGSVVQITGFEYKHRVGPVYQTTSFNPLQNDESQLAQAPVVFVLKIEALQ